VSRPPIAGGRPKRGPGGQECPRSGRCLARLLGSRRRLGALGETARSRPARRQPPRPTAAVASGYSPVSDLAGKKNYPWVDKSHRRQRRVGSTKGAGAERHSRRNISTTRESGPRVGSWALSRMWLAWPLRRACPMNGTPYTPRASRRCTPERGIAPMAPPRSGARLASVAPGPVGWRLASSLCGGWTGSRDCIRGCRSDAPTERIER
jgi:hypothetical protein